LFENGELVSRSPQPCKKSDVVPEGVVVDRQWAEQMILKHQCTTSVVATITGLEIFTSCASFVEA
jgi:hypothetical protein